jgi:voltage-gated potassium channel
MLQRPERSRRSRRLRFEGAGSIQIGRRARHHNHLGRPTTSRTNSGNRDEIVENPTAGRRFLTFEIRHRYTALLIFIAIWLTVLPFLAGDALAIFSMKLVLSVILLSGIYAGRRTRRDLIVGGALGISALFGRWLPQYSTDIRVFLAIDILTVVFLLYITITILNQIHSTHRVTLDTIAGALCAYCLIGLTWAFVYRAIFAFNLRSFLFASRSFAQIFEQKNPSVPQLMNFAYYSFATLTTTQLSDITPMSSASRAIAILETIAGQFFIAILIARLVSLELLHSTHHHPD